jgi:hypothetical protein
MASVVIAGNTSGSITLDAPNVAGTTTLTLPATTGTVLTSVSPASDLPSSIKGPAFSAYLSAGQSIASNVVTLVATNTKSFDTATAFNNTGSTITLNGLSVPAYAFCPPVAGYYQVTCANGFTSTTAPYMQVIIYKNGGIYSYGPQLSISFAGLVNNTSLIYLNGTGDYVQSYVFHIQGGALTSTSGIQTTAFSAAMVRSA